MRKKNWWKEHRDPVRKALIGAAAVALTVSVWGGVRLYQNRKATEAIIAARYESSGQVAEAGDKAGTGHGETSGGTAEAVQGAGTSSTDDGTPETGIPEDILSENMTSEYMTSDGTASDTGQDAVSGTQETPKLLSENLVTYQGKTWRRNSYVKAILCMGVDRKDSMKEAKELGEAGQADGIFLLAQDTARHTLQILMIPRDTMTEITVVNPDKTVRKKEVRQITLAYAYGDGREESCRYVQEAVEGLLGGFPIDYYMAADIGVINQLNDAVGGVRVTVPTAGMEKRDPAFVKGETITLHGEQAEAFVRYRDIEKHYSALDRMDQQKEYITGFFEAVRQKQQENSQVVTQLFDMIDEYMVTDMGKEIYLKVAMDALNAGGISGDSYYMVPGTGMSTELYDEYHADQERVIPVLLKMFYREV